MNDTTTQTEQRSAQLIMLDQQLALGAYLQALLKPAEETPALQSEPVAVVRTQVETAPAAEVLLQEPIPMSMPACSGPNSSASKRLRSRTAGPPRPL